MSSLTPFPDFKPELFIDLAIGVSSFDDCCWANGLDPAAVRPWEGDPEFEHRMSIARRAVDDDGRAFRARCRTVVQDNVLEMEGIIKDKDVTAGHRIDAFKTLAKLGNLEPQEAAGAGSGVGLSLTIIAPGGETVVINKTAQAPIEGQAVQELPPLADDLSVADLMWIEATG
jgi:hypothetical protein